MQILSNLISALNVRKSPKFPRLNGNRGRGTRWWRQILDQKWKCGRFAHAQWKICNITLIYGQIAEMPALYRKSGSRNTMVTSDFRQEVVIRPFRTCAIKNTQNNAYLWSNHKGNRGRGTRWWRQILDRKWKYSLSFMRHTSGHNYRNSSFINCGRGYGADTTFHRTYF